MSRTRAEAAEQEGGAAPPSPNRRTAKALRANAAEGAAAEVVATSAQLAVANARLEAELANLKEQLREAAAEIQHLGGVRRSSLSAESMRTDREAEKQAKFDESSVSTFNLDLSAERTQLSRGVQRVHQALLSACTPVRGTRAHQEDPLRASVGKRAQVVQSVLEGWLPRAGGNYSAVLSSLPKSLINAIETYQYNERRLRDALAVLKYGRSSEDRLNYSIVSTAVAAEVVAERNQRGMGRRVAASYGTSREANSVPARQQLVRAAWDEAVNNKSPLKPRDQIICRNGIGVIESFGSGVGERSVTIKFENTRKTFSSLGQSSLCFVLPVLVSNLQCSHVLRNPFTSRWCVLISGAGRGGARARRFQPSWRPPDRAARSDKLSPRIVADIHACCRDRCAESPCMKDKVRRRRGPGDWEEARARFRHDTWNEYFAYFRIGWPASAKEIESSVHPAECPRAFRDNQPFYLRNKGGDSCLCHSCENCEKYGAGRQVAAALLGGYLKQLKADDDEDDEERMAAAAAGGVTEEDRAPSPLAVQLQDLLRMLLPPSKRVMCLELTCGSTDNDASLSDRACACVEGTCANCGFAAVWTNGVRKSLLSGVLLEGGIEALREDIDEVWCEKLTWCR